MALPDYFDSLPAEVCRDSARALEEVQRNGEAWLLASLDEQKIFLMADAGSFGHCYAMSSARAGVGNLLDSERTPMGLHRVCEKIGLGLAPGAVLRYRVATGEIVRDRVAADSGVAAKITSRILRLEGMNPGYNLGLDAQERCVDSYKRYIYIHGTNRGFAPGEQTSQGCLTLTDADVIDIFERVSVNTLLLITRRAPGGGGKPPGLS